MPTASPSSSAVTLLLFLAFVDLVAASPPSIEAGHYEGLVDPARPIGTLQGIAMDLSLGGSQGDVPFSKMEFIGETASGEWKVIRINSIKWDRYSSPGDLKVVLSPTDVRRTDQCYRPLHLCEQAKRELLRIFDILSIPGPVRMSNSWQIKLCFVAGNAYVFLGGRARASRYTFIRPLLLERVEKRNFKATPTGTSHARGRGDAAITSGGAMVLSTATGSAEVTSPSKIGGPGFGMIQLPPRASFEPFPLADVGELPVGSLVNAEDTGKFYLVCLTLPTDETGRQLVELSLASSGLSPTGAPTKYFRFASATEDTPPSNVLILPLMPLVRKGCHADCYIFVGLTDPADQAEVEASLTAAGRAFGINNLTLGSIRLHRSGMDGGHFELLLGTEDSDPAKPDLRIRLEYTPLPVDSARVTDIPHQPSEFEADISRGKKRSQDQSESDRVVKRTK